MTTRRTIALLRVVCLAMLLGCDGKVAGDDAEDSMGGSSTATEGGEDDVDLPSACAAFCEKMVECFDDPHESECADECFEELAREDEGCQAAAAGFYQCLGELECAAHGSGEDPCGAEEAAIDDACDGDGDCAVGIGVGEDGCEVSDPCSGVSRRMLCDDTTCTCSEDGTEVATCESMGVCDELMGIVAHANTCCGWTL